MRIDLNTGMTVPEGSMEKAATSRSAVQNGAPAGESQFSPSPASVSRLAADVLATPEVRAGKVEEIRSRLEAGTYQLSAGQLASALLEQMRTRP